MKKLVVLMLALMLCLTAAAFAEEAIPSKTTGDLTKVEVISENIPADAGLEITAVTVDAADYEEKIQTCETEIAVLTASESVETYFGEVKDAAGETVDLAAVLETETLNVHEFCPLVVSNYEENYGNVKAAMQFSTPYTEGEKVIVLIGLVTVNEDGTQSVEWIAYEGVGTGAEGAIEVELDAATMAAVQAGNALVAIVSK